MNKHTPAPWTIERNCLNAPVIKAGNDYIAITDRPRQEADARLIAAAPELLDTLKVTTERLESVLRYYDHSPDIEEKIATHPDIRRARAAIQKAEEK